MLHPTLQHTGSGQEEHCHLTREGEGEEGGEGGEKGENWRMGGGGEREKGRAGSEERRGKTEVD